MLYISKYDKFNLDKSSLSIYKYYKAQFDSINTSLQELYDYLNTLLMQIRDIRDTVYNLKDVIQNNLNRIKNKYDSKGWSTNTFDTVQKILDNVEEALNEVETQVINVQNEIECDEEANCNQSTDCYEDCSEGCDEIDCEEVICDEDVIGPCGELAACGESCNHCSYNIAEADDSCDVCQYNNCSYDMQCSQDCSQSTPIPYWNGTDECNESDCTYSSFTDDSCGETFDRDSSCNQTSCTYSTCSYNVPEECTFICEHDSGCAEQSMPTDCSYSCVDGGCSYGGDSCDYCSYSTDCEQHLCGQDCNELEVCSEGGCDDSCDECGQACSEVVCEAGDNYDPSCDELNDDSSDDSGNVICTYIIHRIFNDDPFYLECSSDNIRMALRLGGLSSKAFKEYYSGLGQDIIERLRFEDDNYLRNLWDQEIFKVWITVRTDIKEGMKLYTTFVYKLSIQFNINYHKYKHIVKWFNKYGLIEDEET